MGVKIRTEPRSSALVLHSECTEVHLSALPVPLAGALRCTFVLGYHHSRRPHTFSHCYLKPNSSQTEEVNTL